MAWNSGRVTSDLHGSLRIVEYKIFIDVTKSQVKRKSVGAVSVLFQANDPLAREKVKNPRLCFSEERLSHGIKY